MSSNDNDRCKLCKKHYILCECYPNEELDTILSNFIDSKKKEKEAEIFKKPLIEGTPCTDRLKMQEDIFCGNMKQIEDNLEVNGSIIVKRHGDDIEKYVNMLKTQNLPDHEKRSLLRLSILGKNLQELSHEILDAPRFLILNYINQFYQNNFLPYKDDFSKIRTSVFQNDSFLVEDDLLYKKALDYCPKKIVDKLLFLPQDAFNQWQNSQYMNMLLYVKKYHLEEFIIPEKEEAQFNGGCNVLEPMHDFLDAQIAKKMLYLLKHYRKTHDITSGFFYNEKAFRCEVIMAYLNLIKSFVKTIKIVDGNFKMYEKCILQLGKENYFKVKVPNLFEVFENVDF
uniref:NR LBD domain-containing protein n=1 Tax=Parastrongyloides trichosuri TaxID=131310 RepID=A0A0N4ZE86_PARTI